VSMEEVLRRLDRLEREVEALKRMGRGVLERLLEAVDIMLEVVREAE